MKRNLCELSTELRAISMIVTGLSMQLNVENEHLSAESMQDALYGAAIHIERIAEDLNSMEFKGGSAV